MKITHTQKFVRVSPRKLRLVAGLAKKYNPSESVEVLFHSEKRAAGTLAKVIKTALANAKDQGITDGIKFSEIQIGEGPRLKRGRAVSRGRWHPYQRQMSHVRITLETLEQPKLQTSKAKEEDKSDTKTEVKSVVKTKSKLKKSK